MSCNRPLSRSWSDVGPRLQDLNDFKLPPPVPPIKKRARNLRKAVVVEEIAEGQLRILKFPSIGKAAAHLKVSRSTLAYQLHHETSAVVYFETNPPKPVPHLDLSTRDEGRSVDVPV